LLIKYAGLPPWVAILLGFMVCLSIGRLIGVIVVKTRLPSFIVSLAFLYILRGAVIVSSRTLARSTLVGGFRDLKDSDWLAWLFGGQVGRGLFTGLANRGIIETLPNGTPVVTGLPMLVLWCLGIGAVATFVLSSTRFGNWIFAAGGDPAAARSVGVPVDRVKVLLFVFSAFCATVFGASQVFEFGSADAARGLLKEFEAIIAAVIGGALLTGGYGSVPGALLGALIFGVVSQGFYYTGIDGDWFRIFLGCVLLGAVMFNTNIRKRFTGGL
jgi:simple sugar transport system permease protein